MSAQCEECGCDYEPAEHGDADLLEQLDLPEDTLLCGDCLGEYFEDA